MGDLGKLPGGGDATLGLPLLTFPFLFSQKCTEALPSGLVWPPLPGGTWALLPALPAPQLPCRKAPPYLGQRGVPSTTLVPECRASRGGCWEEEGVSEGDSGRPGVLSLPGT